MFAAWRHAKREGILPDDPIHRRALRYVAVDHRYCETDVIQAVWKLRAMPTTTRSTPSPKSTASAPIGSRSVLVGARFETVDPTTHDVVLDSLWWRWQHLHWYRSPPWEHAYL